MLTRTNLSSLRTFYFWNHLLYDMSTDTQENSRIEREVERDGRTELKLKKALAGCDEPFYQMNRGDMLCRRQLLALTSAFATIHLIWGAWI